jgi:hypothetical protein
VNIGGQRCRDVRGVQLVVLTGTPCQLASYQHFIRHLAGYAGRPVRAAAPPARWPSLPTQRGWLPQELLRLYATGERAGAWPAGGARAGPPALLRQQWVAHSQLRPGMPGAVAAGVAFFDAAAGPLSQLAVVVSNPANGYVLRCLPLATGPRPGRVYAQPGFDAGLRQVAVDITCCPSGRPAYTAADPGRRGMACEGLACQYSL